MPLSIRYDEPRKMLSAVVTEVLQAAPGQTTVRPIGGQTPKELPGVSVDQASEILGVMNAKFDGTPDLGWADVNKQQIGKLEALVLK